MGFYALVAVVSLALLPLSYKRSGSMTHYVPLTGAPIVWLLLMVASGTAAISEAAGAPGTSQAVFSGGLIGTAFVQVVLLRRVAPRPIGRRDAAPTEPPAADPAPDQR